MKNRSGQRPVERWADQDDFIVSKGGQTDQNSDTLPVKAQAQDFVHLKQIGPVIRPVSLPV